MNIGTLLTKTAKTFGKRPGIIHGSQKTSYDELNSRVNALANALCDLGVRKGDTVALLQYNYPQMLESLFACFKAGFCAVPINWRLHPNEFSFIIDHSDSRAVIFSSEFNETIKGVRDSIPKAEFLISLAGEDGTFMDYESKLAGQSLQFRDAEVHPDDTAWLFYTSGTTGMPKGAMLTHRNLLAMTMSFYADVCPGLNHLDVILHAAPLSHGSGLYAIPNIAKGAANVILPSPSFNPEMVLEMIQQHRVSNLFAAPIMIKRLVETLDSVHYDTSSLRAVHYGGAPIFLSDLKRAREKLGECLVQVYGQGEAPMTITCLPQRDHVLEGTPAQMKRLSSAGIARTDVEVRIFDSDDREVPAGVMGEIVTRSDLVMKGYWKNPEATEENLRNGWLHTGDIGYMDEDGYLYIMDRSKDMIITGGENVYPREIEEVIARHPAVREVAVIGVPDDQWGEAIKAIVALVPGRSATEEELISFCRGHIAGYKKPKSVDFVKELPKNNYGKVVKRDLRTRHWEGRERKV